MWKEVLLIIELEGDEGELSLRHCLHLNAHAFSKQQLIFAL